MLYQQPAAGTVNKPEKLLVQRQVAEPGEVNLPTRYSGWCRHTWLFGTISMSLFSRSVSLLTSMSKLLFTRGGALIGNS
jgi:hypothetical protein